MTCSKGIEYVPHYYCATIPWMMLLFSQKCWIPQRKKPAIKLTLLIESTTFNCWCKYKKNPVCEQKFLASVSNFLFNLRVYCTYCLYYLIFPLSDLEMIIWNASNTGDLTPITQVIAALWMWFLNQSRKCACKHEIGLLQSIPMCFFIYIWTEYVYCIVRGCYSFIS